MIKKKRIIAVVPARGNSIGIKLKNLIKINNKSLIAIVAKFIHKCKFIDFAVVSTDNKKITNEAKKNRLQVVNRPKKLSGDKTPDIFPFIHSVINAEKFLKKKFDIAIMLHPTSPLRKVKDIKDSINKLIEGNLDSVWTLSKTDSKHHPDKQMMIKKGKLKYYSKKGKHILYRQQLSQIYHRNSCAYVLNRDFLVNNQKLLGNNSTGHIVESKQISIDTLEDLAETKKYF